VIDNEEITKFRKEKLPMYVGIINDSPTSQLLYDLLIEQQKLNKRFKNIDQEYQDATERLYNKFKLTKQNTLKRLGEIKIEIEKLKREGCKIDENWLNEIK